jgi:hypothetical protein
MHRDPHIPGLAARIPWPAAHGCLAVLILLATLVTGGCTRRSASTETATDVRVDLVELRPDPPAVGQAILVIRLTDAAGSPVEGASVDLKADMTHAGMTPVFGDVTDQGNGLYRTSFEWTMAGDWVLTVSGKLEDGRNFQRELQVSVAADGG